MNVKTAEPIGPKFRVGPHMTPGKVQGSQNYKNIRPQFFDFCKIKQKIREKILLGMRAFLF